MEQRDRATILMFGSLYTFRSELGLAPTLEVPLSTAGKRAVDIAEDLGLPLASIGCIYCNHRPASLDRQIKPGDRVAFLPWSSPGPHNGPQGFPGLADAPELPKVALG
jgi:molybdopterin converting factor small subunit